MPYIGNTAANRFVASKAASVFSGDGSETQFTLDHSVGSDEDILVSVDGVIQEPSVAYSVSGTTLTFTAAPSNNSGNNIFVYYLFRTVGTVSHPSNNALEATSGAFTNSVGIGTSSPADKLHISKGSSGISSFASNTQVIMEDDGNVALQLASPNTATQQILFSDPESNVAGVIKYDHSADTMSFFTGAGVNERLFIASNGTILTNKTDISVAVVGSAFYSGGHGAFTRASGIALIANRTTNDGQVVSIRQDNTQEGAISVSGSTVSYTSFTGTHWSRLTDNSKPTILRGTVIETIDEMCDWYQVQFTVKPTDGTSNYVEKVSIALPKGKKVGDKITYKHNDITYDDAVIVKEGDEKHTKCKISDTEDSKRVYGVFMDWDNDDDSVNDMFVMAVGTGVVRISKDVTVNAGDLLSSKGDGTAKVQDDDIVRSKTIGKVLTNIKQETYDDGSYTVPCALYCG